MVFIFLILFDVEQGAFNLLASISKRLCQSIINKKNIIRCLLGEIIINIRSQKHNSGGNCKKSVLTQQLRM